MVGNVRNSPANFQNTSNYIQQQQILQFHNEGLSTNSSSHIDNIPLNRKILECADDGMEHSIKSFLMRPQLVQHFAWSTTPTAGNLLGTSMDLPWDLLSQDMYVDKLRRFLGFRADIEVRVQVNAMPFQAGRLVLVWVPGYKYIGGTRQAYYTPPASGTSLNYLPALTGCPHIDIDISTCTEGTMCLPYISPYTYTNLTNGIGHMGQFQVIVYSPLVDPSGPAAVDVTIFMNFKNIELKYPTGLPIAASAQVGSEALDVASPGVITNASAVVSEALTSIQDIPKISQFVRPALWVSNAVNDVAKRFGWSKPSSVESTSVTKLSTGRFMGNFDGADNSHSLAFSSYNELEQEPSLFRTNVDEMALSHVFRTPTFYQNIGWGIGDAKDKILFSVPIDPTQYRIEVSATLNAPTMLSFACMCFRYWRGGINFTFKFVKTKFHSGRVRLLYVPGDNSAGTVLPSNFDTDANYSTVVDLRSDTDVSFNVPYVAIQQWMTIDNSIPTSDSDYRFSTGRLYVIVLNELRAPTTVGSTVDIIMEVAGASDFEVAVPCVPSVYAANRVTPPTLEVDAITTQSSILHRLNRSLKATAQVGEAEALIAPTEVIQSSGLIPNPIVPKVHTSTDFISAALTIGEKVSSIRQLAKRFALIYDSSSLTDQSYSLETYIQPDLFSSPLTGSDKTRYVDYYAYYAYIYSFYRGGFRIKWGPWDASHSSVQYTTRARLVPTHLITGNGLPVQEGQALVANQYIGADVYVPLNNEGLSEFQAPYYSRYPILPLNPNGGTTQDLYANNGIAFKKFTYDDGSHGLYYRATADDFSFGQLLGPPFISTFLSPGQTVSN